MGKDKKTSDRAKRTQHGKDDPYILKVRMTYGTWWELEAHADKKRVSVSALVRSLIENELAMVGAEHVQDLQDIFNTVRVSAAHGVNKVALFAMLRAFLDQYIHTGQVPRMKKSKRIEVVHTKESKPKRRGANYRQIPRVPTSFFEPIPTSPVNFNCWPR